MIVFSMLQRADKTFLCCPQSRHRIGILSCNKMLKMSVQKTSKTPSQQKKFSPTTFSPMKNTNYLCKHLLCELWVDLRRGQGSRFANMLGSANFLEDRIFMKSLQHEVTCMDAEERLGQRFREREAAAVMVCHPWTLRFLCKNSTHLNKASSWI